MSFPPLPPLPDPAPATSGSAAYVLDLAAKRVLHPERGAFRVSPREFALLEYLHRRRGELVSVDELIRDVWGEAYGVSPELVRVTVYQLRKRAGPEVIDTVPFFGYGVGIAGIQHALDS